MPLQTMGDGGSLLAALIPPGNVAAEIAAFHRKLFHALGSPAAFPFPCAAPLATLSGMLDPKELSVIAEEAPKIYDRLVSAAGFIFLAPAATCAAAPESASLSRDARSFPELPCGLGFPLAFFANEEDARKALAGLPTPPHIAFHTFQAVILNIRWAEPRYLGLVWETLATLRYPIRIL